MTTDNNFNNQRPKFRVLVAPLDWGLGHATRCIPIINELINLNCEVFVAADKLNFSLLKKEFPSVKFLRLKVYEMKYSQNKNWLPVKMLLQIPKIALSIWKENRWMKRITGQYKLDAVISDNRFGMYSDKIFCIYITHQLFIKTGNIFTDKIAQRIHNYFIKKYTNCWVPDCKENGLAGKLSHPQKIPSNVKYIGPLSRFETLINIERKFDLLVSISGPEPQRSIFEKIILLQLRHFTGSALVLRGLPSETNSISSPNNLVTIANHLPAKDFNIALQQSEMIISRSGYTSIMDLIKLKKKAILIPTPGQTEQEYLAKYLFNKKYFYLAGQENFSLKEVLNKTATFPFAELNFSSEDYKIVIHEFVLSLKTGNFAPQ